MTKQEQPEGISQAGSKSARFEPASQRDYDVIVIGAGAAGLMCAATAAKRSRRVALLDHSSLPGRKILISGGGRCNFTNLHCHAGNFLSSNPHFAKSALANYTPRHFIELVKKYGIPYHEKTLGQLFCDHSSHAILDLLLEEVKHGQVESYFDCHSIHAARDSSGFRIESSRGIFRGQALVVATGGLSIPQLGATGFGYDLANQWDVGVIQPRPALVPFLLGGKEQHWTKLSGVAVPARLSNSSGKTAFEEKILITHRGLSGPAVLQISSYWEAGKPIYVDFLPDREVLLGGLATERTRENLKRILRSEFPARLADQLTESIAPSRWTNAAIQQVEDLLHHYPFHPEGTEGFAKAEVTAGGVDTRELHSRTMECRNIPGLFFIGEVVDVTGWLGGYNFQWAWASAVAAGNAV